VHGITGSRLPCLLLSLGHGSLRLSHVFMDVQPDGAVTSLLADTPASAGRSFRQRVPLHAMMAPDAAQTLITNNIQCYAYAMPQRVGNNDRAMILSCMSRQLQCQRAARLASPPVHVVVPIQYIPVTSICQACSERPYASIEGIRRASVQVPMAKASTRQLQDIRFFQDLSDGVASITLQH
jgi:hypothetical protein